MEKEVMKLLKLMIALVISISLLTSVVTVVVAVSAHNVAVEQARLYFETDYEMPDNTITQTQEVEVN